MTALGKIACGLRTFASDVAQGFFEITHNGFALVGLAVVFSVITLTARPDLRQAGETKLRGWLQARKVAAAGMEIELDASDRATAVAQDRDRADQVVDPLARAQRTDGENSVRDARRPV
jgi:hypothetical protein